MPFTTKTKCSIWIPHADAHRAKRADRFKDNVKHGKAKGVFGEVWRFNDGDDPDGECKPPEVVRELSGNLFFEEEALGNRVVRLVDYVKDGGGGSAGWGSLLVYANLLICVVVGVADGHDDGIDGDVHPFERLVWEVWMRV